MKSVNVFLQNPRNIRPKRFEVCTDARIIAVLRAGKDAPLTGNVARQDCILKDVERVAELAARDHLQNEATKRGREKDAKDKNCWML